MKVICQYISNLIVCVARSCRCFVNSQGSSLISWNGSAVESGNSLTSGSFTCYCSHIYHLTGIQVGLGDNMCGCDGHRCQGSKRTTKASVNSG